MKYRPILLIFFLALLSSTLVHYFNYQYLFDADPSTLREGVSVITQDDASYLAPVENAIVGKGWRSNALGDAAFVTRTPGYSLLYATFRIWLSQKSALIGLLALQFLLFAFSSTLVHSICKLVGMNQIWAFWLALVYAVLPMFSGFLSYTLTEAVTPAIVIVFLYLILKSYEGKKSFYEWSALVLACLIIIRPPMVVFVFAYPIQLAFDGWKLHWKKTLSAISICLVPILLWQIYGYGKTEELPGLHAIYHDDANDLYRPVHRELWDFHKSWGQTGNEFHNDVNGIWQAALSGESPEKAIENLINQIPEEVIETVGVEGINWTYESYYAVLEAQAPFFKSGQVMTGQTPLELTLVDSIQIYTNTYRSAFWFQTWMVVPIKVYWKLAAHSNLSLYVFQKPWRGNLFIEALRWLSLLIHLGVFILFPIVLILKLKNKTVATIAVPIALYLVYLCLIQRGIEERYTLPVLLPMLLTIAIFVINFINQFYMKNGKTD